MSFHDLRYIHSSDRRQASETTTAGSTRLQDDDFAITASTFETWANAGFPLPPDLQA